ncbi:MAG: PEP-CTERM sorting domain-containing protein [Xenococcaceae cyanobacterium MO_188.B29]|nr:PEP-CTERM sorting domain-containing protein [Xenococcaceae cyanobacterium MO_188.B29]
MKVEKLNSLTPSGAGFACLVTVGLLLAGVKPAQAQFRSSRVDSNVTDQGNGEFLYEFEVFNTSGFGYGYGEGDEIIVDWELPIFSLDDLDVDSITSPQDWTFEIVERDGTIAYSPDTSLIGTDSLFFNNPAGPYGQYEWDYIAADDPLLIAEPDLYGPNPEVFETPPFIIHWYTLSADDEEIGFFPINPIFAQDSLDGFGFESEFTSINAPYLSSWFFLPPVGGDPPIPGGAGFGTPNSPARQQAQSITTPVPEPGSVLGLLVVGTGIVASRLKKKTRKRLNNFPIVF